MIFKCSGTNAKNSTGIKKVSASGFFRGFYQYIYMRFTTIVYDMAGTVSVRVDRADLSEIDQISRQEKSTKSSLLREILGLGLKTKKLSLALEKFRKNELTALKASKLAGVPLTEFLDLLKKEGLEFHYTQKELEQEFAGLV